MSDGYPDVIPMIAYENGVAALEWLATAFGFSEHMRLLDDDGRPMGWAVEGRPGDVVGRTEGRQESTVEPVEGRPHEVSEAGFAEGGHHQEEGMVEQRKEETRRLNELSQRYADAQRQLEEKDRQIEELTAKLQNSSQLLLKISQELDGSLPPVTQPGKV